MRAAPVPLLALVACTSSGSPAPSPSVAPSVVSVSASAGLALKVPIELRPLREQTATPCAATGDPAFVPASDGGCMEVGAPAVVVTRASLTAPVRDEGPLALASIDVTVPPDVAEYEALGRGDGLGPAAAVVAGGTAYAVVSFLDPVRDGRFRITGDEASIRALYERVAGS